MNHVGWRYFRNPWRKYCWRWWKHLFNARALYFDIRDTIQRARRGWGNGDIFDLMTYHAGVTIGLLKHFKANHHGYIESMGVEDYEAALDLAIDGWEAKYALLTGEGLDDDKFSYEEWSSALERRWKKGYAAFLEIYDSLWN